MSGSTDNQPPETGPPNSPGENITVPKAVVSRLSLYLRELQQLILDGQETTSSTQLGSRLGFTDAQVRKDLAYFGQFGYPGIGYRCDELIRQIKKILGTDRDWPVALVGLGNLGTALLGYRGFGQQGFRVVAAFDTDPAKVGRQIAGVSVYPFDRLPEIVRNEKIRIGIVAVPAAAAQAVADRLVESGVTGILNFAPVTIKLPEEVSKVAVDLAIELEQLCFAVVKKANSA
ncbi:MAG: redox-sensing transcriptional repressor Rex [Pirellulaceae bacterium]